MRMKTDLLDRLTEKQDEDSRRILQDYLDGLLIIEEAEQLLDITGSPPGHE